MLRISSSLRSTSSAVREHAFLTHYTIMHARSLFLHSFLRVFACNMNLGKECIGRGLFINLFNQYLDLSVMYELKKCVSR